MRKHHHESYCAETRREGKIHSWWDWQKFQYLCFNNLWLNVKMSYGVYPSLYGRWNMQEEKKERKWWEGQTEFYHWHHSMFYIMLCWRRQWHPTPVLLPRKSHRRRSLVGYSPWGPKELDTTDMVLESIPISIFSILFNIMVQFPSTTYLRD